MSTQHTPLPDGPARAAAYNEAVRGRSPEAILGWALAEFGHDGVALASSLGPEDQVLTEMFARVTPTPRLFTLDTGRIFSETYALMQQTMAAYGVRYEVAFPEASEVAALVREHGPNLFYEGRALRLACCEVRKVRPLRRILTGLEAWLCGLRRDQSLTRTDTQVVAWDTEHHLFKVSPLADWSEEAVWDYVRAHAVPTNALHAVGMRSIGCAPCTRAVEPGEDVRAGRWWWEEPEHRECGLHSRHTSGPNPAKPNP